MCHLWQEDYGACNLPRWAHLRLYTVLCWLLRESPTKHCHSCTQEYPRDALSPPLDCRWNHPGEIPLPPVAAVTGYSSERQQGVFNVLWIELRYMPSLKPVGSTGGAGIRTSNLAVTSTVLELNELSRPHTCCSESEDTSNKPLLVLYT